MWGDTRGWRLGAPPSSVWRFAGRDAAVEAVSPAAYAVRLNSQEHAVRLIARSGPLMQVELAGRIQSLRVIEFDRALHLFRSGRHAVLRLVRTDDALQAGAGAEEGSLLTPLPGTVVAVHVSIGQRVARGAPLVTVEAMKMEHTLSAPYDGVATRIPYGLGDRVAAGSVLVELSPPDP